ncbi:hypothetical protein JOB18_004780 [Solea senegalensis]|uniref:Uncharacterized protein n=1 Tax=Solea senegalensis TaxID=28829 RepID=A0AAV6S4N0_SOLSE|nr:hypothetical protein JOB18_004780 [Solea senegalensis]
MDHAKSAHKGQRTLMPPSSWHNDTDAGLCAITCPKFEVSLPPQNTAGCHDDAKHFPSTTTAAFNRQI